MKSGSFKLTGFDLATHFEEDMIEIEKFDPEMIISIVYFEGKSKKFYIKRFSIDMGQNGNKSFNFIGEHSASKLIAVSIDHLPQIEVEFDNSERKRQLENEIINIEEFITVKGYKAKGKRVSNHDIKKIKLLDPLPYEEKSENDDEITDEKVDEVEDTIKEKTDNKVDKSEKKNDRLEDKNEEKTKMKKEKDDKKKEMKKQEKNSEKDKPKENDTQISLEF